MNEFCKDIGVTRNMNVIQYERLQFWARTCLNETSRRVMGVLDPLKVLITNLPAPRECEVPDFPFAPERGTHKVVLTPEVFIDASDFRLEDSSDYYGLAPGKAAILKYAFVVTVTEVVRDDKGQVLLLKVEADLTGTLKPKGAITWVSAEHGVRTEVRLYNHLFTVETPDDDNWESQLNPASEEVRPGAMVDPSVLEGGGSPPAPLTTFQLERVGYFTVDPDTGKDGKRLVLNRVVTLRESGPKKDEAAPSRSRKEEQARQLAEKLARQNVDPRDMFRSQTDLYSAFDADGVPTHSADGESLSKNAVKKLKKEWEKQKKLFEKAGGSMS